MHYMRGNVSGCSTARTALLCQDNVGKSSGWGSGSSFLSLSPADLYDSSYVGEAYGIVRFKMCIL